MPGLIAGLLTQVAIGTTNVLEPWMLTTKLRIFAVGPTLTDMLECGVSSQLASDISADGWKHVAACTRPPNYTGT